jgi:hypothetical protein
MDTKPTKIPDSKAQAVPDLRVTPEQAADVKAGKIYEPLCKGTHLPEVVIE